MTLRLSGQRGLERIAQRGDLDDPHPGDFYLRGTT